MRLLFALMIAAFVIPNAHATMVYSQESNEIHLSAKPSPDSTRPQWSSIDYQYASAANSGIAVHASDIAGQAQALESPAGLASGLTDAILASLPVIAWLFLSALLGGLGILKKRS